MSTLTIRDARAADLATLVDFNQRLAFESEGKKLDPNVLAHGVAAVLGDRSKGFYLVAERDGRVVGQLMVTYEWSDWRNADWWWFQSVYVAAEARRQSVFKTLYEAIVARAKAAGAHGLRLYVENENHAAQATYAKLGMKLARYQLFELGEE
jgi:L-amino acid N-acyltransferase YncA